MIRSFTKTTLDFFFRNLNRIVQIGDSDIMLTSDYEIKEGFLTVQFGHNANYSCLRVIPEKFTTADCFEGCIISILNSVANNGQFLATRTSFFTL